MTGLLPVIVMATDPVDWRLTMLTWENRAYPLSVMLDGFPTELVTTVLQNLGARDIISLSAVRYRYVDSDVSNPDTSSKINRRVRQIVHDSTVAQYTIELYASGHIDVHDTTPVQKKLHLLREHDERLRRLELRQSQTLGPPGHTEVHQMCLMGYDGHFIDVSTFPIHNRTEMRIWRPPSSFDPSPPPPILVNFDFCVTTFTVNEPSDLLVLIREGDS